MPSLGARFFGSSKRTHPFTHPLLAFDDVCQSTPLPKRAPSKTKWSIKQQNAYLASVRKAQERPRSPPQTRPCVKVRPTHGGKKQPPKHAVLNGLAKTLGGIKCAASRKAGAMSYLRDKTLLQGMGMVKFVDTQFDIEDDQSSTEAPLADSESDIYGTRTPSPVPGKKHSGPRSRAGSKDSGSCSSPEKSPSGSKDRFFQDVCSAGHQKLTDRHSEGDAVVMTSTRELPRRSGTDTMLHISPGAQRRKNRRMDALGTSPSSAHARDQSLGKVLHLIEKVSPDQGKEFQFIPGRDGERPLVSFAYSQLNVIQQYFMVHDVDKSGALSCQECINVIDDLGRTPEEGSEDAEAFSTLSWKADNDKNGELDWEEFITFLTEYYQSVYERIFEAYAFQNNDGNLVINTQDIDHGIVPELKRSGFALDDVHLEDFEATVERIDKATMDFKEFCELMDDYRIGEFCQIQETGGFTIHRMQFLQERFDRFDTDGSGELDLKEIIQLTESAFLPIQNVDAFISIFALVDTDRTASLDFEEFLRLVRVWNKQSTRQSNSNGQSSLRTHTHVTMTSSRISSMLTKQFSRKDSKDSWADQSPSQRHAPSLTREMTQDIMFREMEDNLLAKQLQLNEEEVRAMHEAFEFYDTDGSGSISHSELVPFLGNLGLPPNTRLQKQALQKILEEADSELPFKDLLNLILEYHKALAHFLVDECCEGDDNTGIPVTKIAVALYQVGQYMSNDRAWKMLIEVGQDELDDVVGEDILADLLKLLCSERILEFSRRWGFKDDDIENFKKSFDLFGSDCEPDYISLDSVGPFLEDVKYAPQNEQGKSTVIKSLVRLDRTTSGRLHFHDALLVLRHLEHLRRHESLAAEVEVIEKFEIDADSVEMLRTLFNAHAVHGKGRMMKNKAKDILIRELCVVKNHDQRQALFAILNDFGPADAELTFAEFLLVLNRLDQSDAF